MKVTAIRAFTYDLEEVKATIRELHQDASEELSNEEAMDYLDSMIVEDMRSPLSRHELTVVDEDGNEI
jgi:hypothetical protein